MSARRVNKTAVPHTVDIETPNEKTAVTKPPAGLMYLLMCVIGIYASFLSWGVLQERIATTAYGADLRIFRASNLISIVQASFACLAGIMFLRSNPKTKNRPALPSNPALIKQYAFIALCHTLSGPFTYSSLKHVDYITVLLAKSCKLVPVMAVHFTWYRTKFPLYKYMVVGLVTLGVFMFSFYGAAPKSSTQTDGHGQLFGMGLLACGLILDGLYNTTQDEIFKRFGKTGEVSGPQMMVVMNLLTALFSTVTLVISGQLSEVLWFATHHPIVYRDIALFALCGACGQIFIFLTLEHFGSLVLVTTTVTRKMFSMLLSVVLFNHKLKGMQWFGVLLVFGGIAGEAIYKRMAK